MHTIMESPQTHGLSMLAVPAKETAGQDLCDPNASGLLRRAKSGL